MTYPILRFSLCAWLVLSACSAPEPTVSSRHGQVGPRVTPSGSSQLTGSSSSSAAGSGATGPTAPGAGGPLVKASPTLSLQGKVCASATVQTAKATPTIYFVIDGSGSMCADFGGGATRWNALRSALLDPNKGLVHRLQDSVKFGITLYELLKNTEAAAQRGVFGVPTFFVGNEMFFGKDRLGQLEELLAHAAAR